MHKLVSTISLNAQILINKSDFENAYELLMWAEKFTEPISQEGNTSWHKN